MSSALANSLVLLNEIREQLSTSKPSQGSKSTNKNKSITKSIDTAYHPTSYRMPVINFPFFQINYLNRFQMALIHITRQSLVWVRRNHYVLN